MCQGVHWHQCLLLSQLRRWHMLLMMVCMCCALPAGNAVWGSSPSVDLARNQVYIATGNNYEIPEELAECIRAVGTPLTPANMQAALDCEKKYPGNYHNCMLALDLDTGAVKWVEQLGGPDAWNAACFFKVSY
jgi:polyvinyl alcohol dehydrogenase (cytochrome)